MASHYMLCRVSGPFEQVVQSLGKRFGNVHNEIWETSQGRVTVILEESYFLRSSSMAAILMVLKEVSDSETNLELIACAGASGLLGFSWGAHKAYAHEIRDSLQKSGFKVEVIKEIPDYNSSSTQPS